MPIYRNVFVFCDRPALLTTKTDRTVHIHPKSVNMEEEQFASQWLIYHLKMKTAKVSVLNLCPCISVKPHNQPAVILGSRVCREDRGHHPAGILGEGGLHPAGILGEGGGLHPADIPVGWWWNTLQAY